MYCRAWPPALLLCRENAPAAPCLHRTDGQTEEKAGSEEWAAMSWRARNERANAERTGDEGEAFPSAKRSEITESPSVFPAGDRRAENATFFPQAMKTPLETATTELTRRVPPHSVEAERAVLAGTILRSSVMGQIAPCCGPRISTFRRTASSTRARLNCTRPTPRWNS